jgi:hypothetical protein
MGQNKNCAPKHGKLNPLVVCLCGSTKFKEQYEEVNRNETLRGNIVLSVGLFGHIEGLDMDSETKQKLDELHLRKIEMADEIFVVNPGGYIGASTMNEIKFATKHGKPIRYYH